MDIAVFDMYYLLVEVLFGSILIAGLAMAVIYIIIMTLMRVSPLTQLFIILFFAVTFGIGYGGAIFAVAGFIGGFMYFATNVYQAIMGGQYT